MLEYLFMYKSMKDAGQAKDTANAAERKTTSAERHIENLEWRTDRIALACQALFEILQEHAGIGESQVLEKMQEIDLRDGRSDSKISNQVIECVHCGKKIGSLRQKCMYCGENVSGKTIVH